MKAIYKLHFDCGRQGTLFGVFVAEKEAVDELVKSGETIYFGEVLGKHSEILGSLRSEDFTLVTDNEEFISKFEEFDLSNGHNPFDYIEQK